MRSFKRFGRAISQHAETPGFPLADRFRVAAEAIDEGGLMSPLISDPSQTQIRKCAMVTGCDPDTTLTLTLMLEILGWTIEPAGCDPSEAQLIFVGEERADALPRKIHPLPFIVLVQAPNSPLFRHGIAHAAILRIPVDIRDIEQIIIAAS